MQVPFLHLLMANQFQQMKKASEVNAWTYIRKTYPQFCTVHAVALAPHDTIFRFLMVFIDEKCTLGDDMSCTHIEFCNEAAAFISENKLRSKGRLNFPDLIRTEANEILKELLKGQQDDDTGYFPVLRVI